MSSSRHKIVIEIIVETLDERPQDPAYIAEQYKNMAIQYRSIGASEARVVSVNLE